MTTRQSQIQNWWEHKSTIYPFHAEGAGDPAAFFDEHPIDFISVVLKPNTRTWAFKTEEDRQLFLSSHPHAKAI